MTFLNLNPDQHFYLQTIFQSTIEHSLQLSSLSAPEQTPYVHKYQSIQKLQGLLSQNPKSESKAKINHPFDFIIHIILGEIYSDVEQTSDSIKSYEIALINYQKFMNSLSAQKQIEDGGKTRNLFSYAQYLLVIYNMLGLSYINRDQNQEGMGCFSKAMNLYNQIITLKQRYPEALPNCYHNRSDEAKGRKFRCYYLGGLNFEEIESSHTLTLFYLAQTHTKLGFKEKAAENCGKTLQRQYATNKYQLNDFCLNLIGLSEYYQGCQYYAQSQYILMLGMEILPEGKKKKMRAKLQIALGDLYTNMLEWCVEKIKQKNEITDKDIENSNKKFLIFQSFKQPFPTVSLAKNLDQCKSLFRKSNTQYKKALEVFVLDGYVTEYIDILFAISKLYHNLCKIDLSRERVCGMLEKRRQMLEPLLKQLNPKAYAGTWQKILVETSEIYSDLFQLRMVIAMDQKDQKNINEDKLKAAVSLGEKLNQYYAQIISVLESDTDAQKNEQYYRSIINSKFNIAKMTSKMYSKDPKKRVQYLKRSWQQYKEVAEYITKKTNSKQLFAQQLQLTEQMISMLPAKIDKINYGLVSPFQ